MTENSQSRDETQGKRPRRKSNLPMQAYYFSNIFSPIESITREKASLLKNVFVETGFRLPTRAELRKISRIASIPQTTLRRWFTLQLEAATQREEEEEDDDDINFENHLETQLIIIQQHELNLNNQIIAMEEFIDRIKMNFLRVMLLTFT